MKWITVAVLICSLQSSFGETAADVAAELKKFTAAYDSVCLEKKDTAALDAHMMLRKTNPKAATVIADYWYAKAVQSYPGKWTGAVLNSPTENVIAADVKEKECFYLVSYYTDHIAEIKATVEMLLVMTK